LFSLKRTIQLDSDQPEDESYANDEELAPELETGGRVLLIRLSVKG